jgi:hypothetical protein
MISKGFKAFDEWIEGKLDEQTFGTASYWLWYILWFSWMVFYEFVVVYGLLVIVLMVVIRFIKPINEEQ